MVLFYDGVAKIILDLLCPQYVDNIFIGAMGLKERCAMSLCVFQRDDKNRVNVKYEKIEWTSTTI